MTSGKYNLYRPNNSTNTIGFNNAEIANTAFGLTLLPERSMARRRPLLSALCHLIPTIQYIKFTSAEREGSITSNYGWGVLSGRSDISVLGLGPRPFLPILFRFTAAIPDNLYELMQTSPYGYFGFRWKGNEYKGFVDEISQTPARRNTISCSLIAHPSTNLSTLI
jgi:hypothetical protein